MGCRKGEAMSCSAALARAPAPTPLTATAAASRSASSSALGASSSGPARVSSSGPARVPLGASSSGLQNPGDSEKDAMPMTISGSCATQASAQKRRAGRGAEVRWVADQQGSGVAAGKRG